MATNTSYAEWKFVCLEVAGEWRRWSGPWEDSADEVLAKVQKAWPARKFALLPGRFIGARTWDKGVEDFISPESALVIEKAPWED